MWVRTRACYVETGWLLTLQKLISGGEELLARRGQKFKTERWLRQQA